MKIQIAYLPIAALAGFLYGAPAFAGHAEPGLWRETTVAQIQMPGAPADSGASRPISGTYCRTSQEALRDAPPVVGRDCTQRNLKWKGNTVAGETVCAPPISGSGKFSITFTGGTHYTGGYEFAGTAPGGHTLKMTTHFTADWVSADCGKVKALE